MDLPDPDRYPIAWACLAHAHGQLDLSSAERWLLKHGLDRRTAGECLRAAKLRPRPGFGELSNDPAGNNHAPSIRRKLTAPQFGRMLQT